MEYVYKENDSLFYYDEIKESFELLYDFSAMTGDTYTIPTWYGMESLSHNDSIYIRVDSVSTIQLEHEELNYYYATYGLYNANSKSVLYNDYPIGEYIEDIGCINTFFHYPENGGCDDLHTVYLNCFEYPEEEVYKFTEGACDSIVSNFDISLAEEIDIFPNPTSDFINIASETISDFSLDIYNLTGQNVYSNYFTNTHQIKINIENFESGLHFIRLEENSSGQKRFYSSKIMIQR